MLFEVKTFLDAYDKMRAKQIKNSMPLVDSKGLCYTRYVMLILVQDNHVEHWDLIAKHPYTVSSGKLIGKDVAMWCMFNAIEYEVFSYNNTSRVDRLLKELMNGR